MGIFIHEVSFFKKVAPLLFKCIFYSWKMKVISYTTPSETRTSIIIYHYHLKKCIYVCVNCIAELDDFQDEFFSVFLCNHRCII